MRGHNERIEDTLTKMNYSFLKTHYQFSQISHQGASNTRQNMDEYEYGVVQAINSGRIGNLRPVLLKPSSKMTLDTGNMTRMCVKTKEYGYKGKCNV